MYRVVHLYGLLLAAAQPGGSMRYTVSADIGAPAERVRAVLTSALTRRYVDTELRGPKSRAESVAA